MKLNCLILLAFAFAACGHDPDYVIPSTTKIADDATKAALTAVNDDGSLTFSSSTGVLESLSVGDILNSNVTPVAPYGLLRKITAIDRSGGQVTLQTVQGSLAEAIERGTFEFSKAVSIDDLANLPRLGGGGLPSTAFPSVTFDHGIRLGFNDFQTDFTSAGDGTIAGSLGIDGFMRFNPVLSMHADIHNFHVDSFDIALTFDGDSDLALSTQLQLAFDENKELFMLRLTIITVPIGPFVIVLQPVLHFSVGVAGSIAVTMSFHEVGSFDGVVGTRYDDGRGWTSLNHGSSSGMVDNFPSFGLSAELDAYVAVGADVLLYGAVSSGPVFTVKAGPTLDFATPRDPFLQAGLRLVADLSLHLYALQHEFAETTLAEYNQVFPIWSSPNSAPILAITTPGNNLSFAPDAPIHFQAAVYDLEDGAGVSMTWTSDLDGVLGTGGDFTTTLHPAAPGVRTITVDAVDSGGLHQIITFQLTITHPGPLPVIAEPRVSQALYTYDSIVRGSATSEFFPGADLCGAGFSYQWTSDAAGDVVGPIHCNLNSARATITYVGAGTRTLTFTVTDPFGGISMATRFVTVADPPPQAFYGSSGFSSPTASSVSATSTVLINGTADPRKIVTDPYPFQTTAPLTFTFTAMSYAADGITELATVDIGSKVDVDKLTAGTGATPPIAWIPGSTPGFIDPVLAATGAGQLVVLSFTAIDGIGHLGTASRQIQVTP